MSVFCTMDTSASTRLPVPDARLEAVVVSVDRSDRSCDRRSDRAHSLRRMTDIGSDEHSLVRDARLGKRDDARSGQHRDIEMVVSLNLQARARGWRR